MGINTANLNFDILVYTSDKKMNNPYDGTKAVEQNCYRDTAGIYTIELDNKVFLKKNSKKAYFGSTY